MELIFELGGGTPYYELLRDGKQVIEGSKMGFKMEWRDDLEYHFVVKNVEYSTLTRRGSPCGARRPASATTTTRCW